MDVEEAGSEESLKDRGLHCGLDDVICGYSGCRVVPFMLVPVLQRSAPATVVCVHMTSKLVSSWLDQDPVIFF